jgi:hypothetical protein
MPHRSLHDDAPTISTLEAMAADLGKPPPISPSAARPTSAARAGGSGRVKGSGGGELWRRRGVTPGVFVGCYTRGSCKNRRDNQVRFPEITKWLGPAYESDSIIFCSTIVSHNTFSLSNLRKVLVWRTFDFKLKCFTSYPPCQWCKLIVSFMFITLKK